MTDSVTVAITNYNYGDYVGSAIRSVLSQTRPPNDWYVVDDGSTDKSASIYDSYPGRVLFNKKHFGVGLTFNKALFHCKTDWIIYLDADDELPTNYIEKCLETAKVNGVPWVYTDLELSYPDGRKEYYGFRPFSKSDLDGGNFIHTSALIRTELIREAGGWREMQMADWDLWKRVSDHGHVAVKAEGVVLKVRRHGESHMLTGRGLVAA